jgi:hypothetical protein
LRPITRCCVCFSREIQFSKFFFISSKFDGKRERDRERDRERGKRDREREREKEREREREGGVKAR